jgi:hypothetical protein
MKTVEALKRFPYDGKTRDKGDQLQVPNDHAKLLIGTRNVKAVVVQRNRAMTATAPTTAREGRGTQQGARGSRGGNRSRAGGGNRRGYSRSDTAAES